MTSDHSTARSTLDGLPKQFISSLKVLFDILDEGGTGYVKLTEIQTRWKEEGMKGLPNGVLESLKKVTPSSGLLSFERFVAGLKISLLRSKSSSENNKTDGSTGVEGPPVVRPVWAAHSKSQSHLPSKFQSRPTSAHQHNNEKSTATVRPSIIQQRTLSMPHLADNVARGGITMGTPAKPQLQYNHRNQEPHGNYGKAPMKNNISTTLKNWQHDQMNPPPVQREINQFILKDTNPQLRDRIYSTNRGVADGKTLTNTDRLHDNKDHIALTSQEEPAANYRRSVARKRETRRHTLANGIDYSMLKRMKQLEQEKDVLLQGLEAVEQAKDWYQKQVQSVQEKQKYIGKATSHADYSVDAHQERMNFQMARIFEVNQQLRYLLDSNEKGFPLHMNLAISHPVGPSSLNKGPSQNNNVISKQLGLVKEQNKLLTQEVSKKSDRISQLERDKTSLIKELFQARSKNNKPNYDDATFM